MDRFAVEGYAIFRGAIMPAAIEAFWDEFIVLRDTDPLLQFSEYGKVWFGRDDAIRHRREDLRVINIQNRSPIARYLATHDGFFGAVVGAFGRDLACIQTLCYSRSSRQAAHSDKFLVTPPYVQEYDRESLCAAWIACEDADEFNGGLVIYPGSHLVQKPRVEDFNGDYDAYVQHLLTAVSNAGIAPQTFQARKGDVLVWHGDFVHAGGIPIDPQRSRASLVCHYAAVTPETVLRRAGAVWTANGRFVFGGSDS
jgi:hypothetical protein